MIERTNLMLGMEGKGERNEVADAAKEERAGERKCEVGMVKRTGSWW